ncbi:AAA family ATPase [Streptomyces sp. L2]|uniref:AAA family ATPase n=1 Tax=Streptomyces sp. L2 TaxID=2162665 RepID=UPI001010C4A5|nr:AAA family ATPase [Streptomyces sp. L2]
MPEHREALALLAEQAERARAGSGRVVLVRGATGTGRTTVLEAAAEDAAARGMRVLRARCFAENAGVPFGTVLQLLGSVPGSPPAPALGEGDERARGEELWQTLRSYAAEAPLLVAVDDVHLADAPSHRWLVESARHVGGLTLPLLIAVTERSQYDIDPPATGFAHTLSPALVHTHTLSPLSTNAAEELVRSALPDGTVADVLAGCVRAGANNPLLIRALLDDLGADGRQTSAPERVPEASAALYPGAYPAAVSWWLDSAGPATTEVARILAILDEGLDARAAGLSPYDGALAPHCHAAGLPGLLGELTGTDPARVSGWLTAMTGFGLLRRDRAGRPHYAHRLLRDAILTGVPTARRSAAHRAAARAMLQRGAPTESVARRLLAADGTAEETAPSWAFAVLRDAAELAVGDARTDDAVTYLRRALAEPLPEPHRQRLLTELGSLEHTLQGSPAGLPRLSEAVRLAAEPHDRVRAAMALGTALAGRGKARSAVHVLREVGGQLNGQPDLLRTLRTASAMLSEEDQAVRREVYRLTADTAAHSPELLGAAGQSLLVRHAATGGLTSAEEAMRQVRVLLAEPADPLSDPFLVGTAAAIAQWADELDEADRLVNRGLTGLRPAVLHPMRRALLNTRGDIAAARDDHEAALADPGVWRSPPPGTVPGNRHAHALTALVHTGRVAEARRLADALDPREAPDNWEFNRFLYARGTLRAASGDPAAALHDFLECGRRQSSRDVVSPVVTPWRTAAAECRLALGSPREALTLAAEELRLARIWNTPRTVGRALSVVAAATGGRRGLDLAAEATELLRGAPSPTELSRALIRQGRSLTAAGERSRARDCLREAAEHAERAGALHLRGQAERALREGGARRPATDRTGSGALTGSERRIAELAAEGHTNPEIADLLHLARRTVETHLTSTYRKLGIRRRGELKGALKSED